MNIRVQIIALLVGLCLLAGYGAMLLVRGASLENVASDSSAQPLVFYTALGATTPQLPFLAAVRDGWSEGRAIQTRYWKDLDDLRGVMLAGRGDIWLGHVEGFAQAAMRGAPVTLVAVTGWRKFRILTSDGQAASLEELASDMARRRERLAVTPADSPAFALLEQLARRGGPRFTVSRHDPKQLALLVAKGEVSHVLAPEPLATALRLKNPQLRDIDALEPVYARYTGGDGMLPLAGIAMRTDLVRRDPELVKRLLTAMTTAAAQLRTADPEQGGSEVMLGLLPADTVRELGRETVLQSLEHDLVRVVPATEARRAITDYLAVVLPDAVLPGRLPTTFFGGAQ